MSNLDGSSFEFVIVGGGAVGCGVAYSLAQAGHRDVLLLERADQLGAVTTSQGAGLCGQLRDTPERTKLAMHSAETFRKLQAEAPVKPDWHEVGSLRIALSEQSVAQFEGLRSVANECGLDCELLEPAEAGRRWPAMDFGKARKILWCPTDGFMAPRSVVNSYRSVCEEMGVRFGTGTPVDEVVVAGGRVEGVQTGNGTVSCRYLINAGGAHAYHLAQQVGLELPIVPVRHEYFVTVELPELAADFPCFRIPDLTLYGRAAEGGLLLGGWEPSALATDPRTYPLTGSAPPIEPDWDVLGSFEEKLAAFFPGSVAAPKARVGKGWPTFTPDGRFVLGESSAVPGFVMAGGCNAHGISGSGGIGKLLVEALFDEAPSAYVQSLSPDRFAPGSWNWPDATVEARRVYETYYGIAS